MSLVLLVALVSLVLLVTLVSLVLLVTLVLLVSLITLISFFLPVIVICFADLCGFYIETGSKCALFSYFFSYCKDTKKSIF